MKKRLLTIASQPDDEILGCGGTIARLVKEGYDAYTLVLGEGMTFRDKQKDRKKVTKKLAELKDRARKANKIIGVKEVYFSNFPDGRFDDVPLLDIVKIIERIKNKLKPDIIFTNYWDDLNIDHSITYKAVVTATRPLREETTKEIYSFEILCATDWNYPKTFSPDVFFNITDTLNKKLKAMQRYGFELRRFPHPRSLKGVRLNAQRWGMRVDAKYAEAFRSVRIIK